ncbi:hypothetical protein evm_011210 [Chilo suppressalis]|nr:hypothetical protein evm_011210 [Chilo suppressalis]
MGERRSWQVELDISAPQILFVENLCDRDAAVLVVDFGRLRLSDANTHPASTAEPQSDAPDPAFTDDEETFMTPCSTPPGSLLSPSSPPAPACAHSHSHALDATRFHYSLYDRFVSVRV